MDAVEVAEQQDQDGQTDGRLSRSNSEDEKDEYLTSVVLHVMRERHKIHIHSQQHQFDSHQQNDQVLPIKEDANDADCKQNSAEDKKMRER